MCILSSLHSISLKLLAFHLYPASIVRMISLSCTTSATLPTAAARRQGVHSTHRSTSIDSSPSHIHGSSWRPTCTNKLIIVTHTNNITTDFNLGAAAGTSLHYTELINGIPYLITISCVTAAASLLLPLPLRLGEV